MIRRWLAGQFARPSGWIGRRLIGPYLDRLSRGLNRAAFDALGVERGDRLLEVGFGGGDLLDLMLRSGACHVTGAEISEAMLARARRRFRREVGEGRLRLAGADVDALPIPDASVDRACSVNSVYFWKDLDAAARELARVTAAGGRLVIVFQTAEQVRRWPGHRYGFRAYEPSELRAALAQAGFESISTVEGRDPALGDFLCLSTARVGAKAGA